MKKIVYLVVICFIVGCSTKTNTKNKSITPEAPLLKSKSEGYFKAIGTEPFWSLEISEEIIRFQGIEVENEFLVPHSEPIYAMDANVKLYRVNTESGEMEVTISKQSCSDGMSDNKHDYKVDISLKRNNQKENVNYSGCGNYIADYRLFDIWLLEELEGKKVTLNNFAKEVPIIEINSSEKKFNGHGGCNRISGTIFQERELLRFTNIISTRMACGETNMENVFLKALQSSTGYKIKNNRLYLTNPDGMKAIFKKID
ncbi:META domain-containing protein [Flavobacterium azooxidireducens]|uniref:META domain-containing protein n=1 Tax=Flavobacterium azooxidireducens TaxID=1871076 RepID=A0ABY4KDR2_9FLAO|nr:META domain-containing protein [Flavobacterium azooxidireducens]UPQ78912.1 META domain-containing protein [Flavobacterium azooxidireducens]